MPRSPRQSTSGSRSGSMSGSRATPSRQSWSSARRSFRGCSRRPSASRWSKAPCYRARERPPRRPHPSRFESFASCAGGCSTLPRRKRDNVVSPVDRSPRWMIRRSSCTRSSRPSAAADGSWNAGMSCANLWGVGTGCSRLISCGSSGSWASRRSRPSTIGPSTPCFWPGMSSGLTRAERSGECPTRKCASAAVAPAR